MQKLRTGLMIFLAICIIAGCAMLPTAVTKLLDHLSLNQTQYSQISSVQLAFAEVEPRLPILGKLALLQDCTIMEITEEDTIMTEQEALAALWTNLQPYWDIGLLPDSLVKSNLTVLPHLIYNPGNSMEYAVIWLVEITVPESPYYLFSAAIDDETGNLLILNFETDSDFMSDSDPNSFGALVAETYFSALDIRLNGYESQYFDTGSVEITYHFGTLEYGEISVHFNIFPQGVYMYFG